ncbi:amino acid ABC transporter substrate-binding protein [Lentilactobacillus kribbianus]|uniref:amino acid ABC transporter substrate-binding protein n=1 Tax=Lentilactobacillus kribbianus TaxID=2729622 RepID=UPI001551BC65
MKFKRRFNYLTLIITVLMASVIFLTGCTKNNQSNLTQSQINWQKIKQRGTIIIGLDDSFVPMGFQQKNGKITGYDVDLARAVFKQYHLKVDFQPIDWSMNVTELRNGTTDLIWNGLSINEQRQQKINFSEPYLQNKQVLVTQTSSHIKDFAGMSNQRLGVQSGSAGANDIDKYPQILKQKIKDQQPVLYDSFTDGFLDLKANRIQGLLIDSVYANYYVKHQANRNQYRIIASPFPKEYYGVGVKKGNQELTTKVNKGLNRLAKSGKLKRINQKWFGTQEESPLVN